MKKISYSRWISGVVMIALLGVQLAACSTPLPIPGGGGAAKIAQSELKRNASPQVEGTDLQALAQGNSAFAFDLYQAVKGEAGNLFFSPLSLSLALAMTYAGARGDTATQMAQTLHFTLPQERLHPAFNRLDLELTAQQPAGKDKAQPFELSIANSLWGEQSYQFLPEFLDVISLNYGAGMRLVDFVGAAEGARQAINDWVSQETRKKIENLIPPGALSPATRLVLANAIYFKADWLHPFSHDATRDQPFKLLDGGQVSVPMMQLDRPTRLNYMAGEGFQAVELPYQGESVSMLVLLPDEGNFAGFEDNLTAEQLNAIREAMQQQSVMVRLPKFSFEKEIGLADTMAQMGMPDAFCGGQTDFSGIDGSGGLCISQIFHKAFVAVDEKGTEAAAASAVVMMESAIISSVDFIVDRPFLFIILEHSTGSVLFVGRVHDPSP